MHTHTWKYARGEDMRLPLLLLLPLVVDAVSVVDHRPDDEYVVEHEVTYEQAIKQARHLKLYPVGVNDKGPIPGCKACTSDEMSYCQDQRVIEDHCCCEGGYNEQLGFVKHTCRLGPETCKVSAGDCAEYTRLRECCCHTYLASLWKYLAGGATSTKVSFYLVALLLLVFGAVR